MVSVIVPTYNRAQFICQGIDSVLAQGFQDFEIIVVDDGSTDNTVEVLQPYYDRITYIYQENQRVSAARNTGIAASHGDYVAFLDSDDLFLPDKLDIQVRVLDEQPEVGLVVCGYQYIAEDGHFLRESHGWLEYPTITIESIILGGLAPPSAVLVRRSWLDHAGGFDPGLSHSEDPDLWLRLALAGCPMVWEPSIVSQYRVHATNLSRAGNAHLDAHRRMLDKVFADDRLPTHIRDRRNEIYGRTYLSQAARSLAAGDPVEATAHLETALATDPRLLANGGRRLAEEVAGLQQSVWMTDHGAFASLVRDTLHLTASSPLSRTLDTVMAKQRFYSAYRDRDASHIRQTWLRILAGEHAWLFNRGGWSILAQSVLGFREGKPAG
jgi:glycosyltransferase involved in cell wall biosynthesis